MKNAPHKIHLQVGEETTGQADFKELTGVTWSEDKLFDTDIEYINKEILTKFAEAWKTTAHLMGSQDPQSTTAVMILGVIEKLEELLNH